MSSSRRLAALGLAALAAALPLAPAAAAPVTPADWERQVLTSDVKDPTKVDVAPDGDVFIAERTGAIKVWRQDGTLVTAGTLSTSYTGGFATFTPTNPELEEGGLHGLLLDKDFATTRRVFTYYSVKGSYDPKTHNGIFRLSSWVVSDDDKLVAGSEKVLLDIPTEWEYCCHYGGSMAFDETGAILLTVGDDTSPRAEGWNPRDTRTGRDAFNAERTSQNHKDLRGKVLRINPDGTVPADNPHVGNAAYHPLVYSMGWRSNYSMSYDKATGLTFVGNVGPDANQADANRGPQGYDELGVVKRGGGDNHGWPRCIADNKPYSDYDYASGTSEGLLECKDSVSGQGFTPDAVYYRNASTDFPQLGAGAGATIMVGPLYRANPGRLALGSNFTDKLIFADWSRSIMYTVELNAAKTGVNPATITPFSAGQPFTIVQVAPAQAGQLPLGPASPIAMKVGPDGALYLAEYGSAYYNNIDSRISRLVCRGCQPSSADYLGNPPVAPVAPEAAAVADGPAAGTGAGSVGLAAAGALVPLALVGVVRRRRIA